MWVKGHIDWTDNSLTDLANFNDSQLREGNQTKENMVWLTVVLTIPWPSPLATFKSTPGPRFPICRRAWVKAMQELIAIAITSVQRSSDQVLSQVRAGTQVELRLHRYQSEACSSREQKRISICSDLMVHIWKQHLDGLVTSERLSINSGLGFNWYWCYFPEIFCASTWPTFSINGQAFRKSFHFD